MAEREARKEFYNRALNDLKERLSQQPHKELESGTK